MAVGQVYGPVFAGLTASAKAAASPPKRRAKAEAMRHVSYSATSGGDDGVRERHGRGLPGPGGYADVRVPAT